MGSHESEPAYRDRLDTLKVRGRGATLNPACRFEDISLHVLGDHLDAQAAENPHGVQKQTQILTEFPKSILSTNDSPDISFTYSVNPYSGCEHGCIYCYARPTHEYHGLSCGIDFETRIFAKKNAAHLLRLELSKGKCKNDTIVMSGVTDPYQPIERDLGITRGCLEAMLDWKQRVSIITKNRLVLRDLDLLKELSSRGLVRVAISVTSLDNTLAATMEPRASSPAARLDAIRRLADAGVPVIAMIAPIIPGLNDREIPRLLQAVSQAGASGANYVLLRLPYQLKALFLDWLQEHFPQRAAHIESLIRQTRGGALYDARRYVRGRGEGVIADQIGETFRVFSNRCTFKELPTPKSPLPPRPTETQGQLFPQNS